VGVPLSARSVHFFREPQLLTEHEQFIEYVVERNPNDRSSETSREGCKWNSMRLSDDPMSDEVIGNCTNGTNQDKTKVLRDD